MTRFIIPGVDARMDRLAALLEHKGRVFRQEPAEQSAGERTAVILPFPAKEEEIMTWIKDLKAEDFLFVWQKTDREEEEATAKGVRLFAFRDDRIVRAENALGTAEGCLAEVLKTRDRTLSGEAVLVCGYGACGSAIARLFWLCGCEVFVFARARGRREAEADGFNTIPSLFSQECKAFDVVINTIPAAVFPASILESFSEGTSFFQVASGSSGIDADFCRAHGIDFVPLPGLPVRYSPQSEAEALAECILDKIGEVIAWR